jgi:uncharacterized protein (TIGR03437 family)
MFTLIALAVAIGSRPARGQTLTFLHPLSGGAFGSLSVFPSVRTIAADASGVYLVGAKGLVKYDSNGNEAWTRAFGAGEQIWNPAADGAGVYVFGRIFNPPNPQVPFVRRYDADGNELWTRQTTDLFSSTGADASGLYVAGAVSEATVTTPYVRKYDPSGAEQWTRPFGAPILGAFMALALALDGTGVYVVGGNDSLTTMGRYDARGNQLWSRPFLPSVSPFLRVVLAMTADGAGLYLVTPGANNGQADYVLRKYDASGNALWVRPVGAVANALALDATGLYVAGQAGSLPGQCRSGVNGDAFVRKYDPNGAELWTRESFSAFYSSFSSAAGVAVNDTGVYVVGRGDFDPPNTGEGFLAKFEKMAAVVTDSRPRILPGCPVNAASYVGGGVAPGEIVTIFGAAIGPPEVVQRSVTSGGTLDTGLAGVRILFNGAPAPLLYVSDKQSSAIVPYALAGQTSVDVQVEYQGVLSGVMTVPVLPSRPGIFSLDGSGQGPLAIVNEDGSLNSPSNPAARGSIITIYGTGGGERDPAVADGQIVSNVLPRTSLPIFLAFDNGEEENPTYGEVLYAGGSPGSVAGLLQLNVRVPLDALAGKAVAFGLTTGHSGVPGPLTIALR